MRVWRNLAAGVGGSLITAIVGLAVVPVNIRYLGIEAYGLIGFFGAMQAMFTVLDLGLSPTVNREVARCRAMGLPDEARDLTRTLAFVYWGTAILIGIATLIAAPAIGSRWLHSSAIAPAELTRAVILMGVIAALRWPLGLYLGALMGTNRVDAAAAINTASIVLGSAGGVAVLAFVSRTIEAFFLWQAAVAVLMTVIMRMAAWRALGPGRARRFDRSAIKRIWRFTAGMGVTAILGVLFVQLDKIALSRLVGLGELGRYTLAGMAARSLSLLIGPVFNTIYPRLTALVAQGDEASVAELYRTGTRLLMATVLPLAIYVGVFARDLYTLWTGDAALAARVAPVAALLLLGSALNGVMIFPYALQLAYGRSKLTAMTTMVLIVGFIPLLLWLVSTRGILGGAEAWAVLNAVYVPFGMWLTHRHILPGIGWRWLTRDVGLPLLSAMTIAGLGGLAVENFALGIWSRLLIGILPALAASVAVLALTPAVSRSVRGLYFWTGSAHGTVAGS